MGFQLSTLVAELSLCNRCHETCCTCMRSAGCVAYDCSLAMWASVLETVDDEWANCKVFSCIFQCLFGIIVCMCVCKYIYIYTYIIYGFFFLIKPFSLTVLDNHEHYSFLLVHSCPSAASAYKQSNKRHVTANLNSFIPGCVALSHDHDLHTKRWLTPIMLLFLLSSSLSVLLLYYHHHYY